MLAYFWLCQGNADCVHWGRGRGCPFVKNRCQERPGWEVAENDTRTGHLHEKGWLSSSNPMSAVNPTARLVDQPTYLFRHVVFFKYFVGSFNHNHQINDRVCVTGGIWPHWFVQQWWMSGYCTPCLDRCAFFSHKYWDTCLDIS